MKDLSRHIEYLLCEHDSVAIPGIGVFVTEELPARYYPKENLYLPPVRSVRLDTTNKEDDHKLENCLIQLHHVTRNVANKWIAEYTNDINQSLMDMGIMDMGTIGRLVYANKKITFEVCDAGVNTPELYGLDSFHIAKLPTNVHKNRNNTDQTHLTIRLRRTTIHRAMTAAAMLIVALTVILPNYSSFNNSGLKANLNAAKSFIEMLVTTVNPISHSVADSLVTVPKKDNTAVASKPTAESQQVQSESISEEKPTTEALTTVTEETGNAELQQASQTQLEEISTEKIVTPSLEVKGFCIVMASAVTHKGADYLIAKLHKEGFSNAMKHEDKGMLRVLLVGYENEASARAHVSVVKATDKLYSGSWIKNF